MLQAISNEGNALLRAIRNSESSLGDNAYKMRYSPRGGATFTSFADHPRVPESVPWRTDGRKSSAAGAYQFVATTWDRVARRYDIKDFSPASQDKAAWLLAQDDYKRKTGQDLQIALEQGQIDKVFGALSSTWTSLPSGAERNALTHKAHSVYRDSLRTSTSKFYGSIRKTGCETRNAILSTVPFLDYTAINCDDQYAQGTGTGFSGEDVPDTGSRLSRVGERIGYAVLGTALVLVGFIKMRI